MSAADEINEELIQQYLKRELTKKLHIGCCTNVLSGWLNSDISPQCSCVIRLAATGSYPFIDGTFDYIYSEHMIEHVSFKKGQQMRLSP